jgi:hypothetical protein
MRMSYENNPIRPAVEAIVVGGGSSLIFNKLIDVGAYQQAMQNALKQLHESPLEFGPDELAGPHAFLAGLTDFFVGRPVAKYLQSRTTVDSALQWDDRLDNIVIPNLIRFGIDLVAPALIIDALARLGSN